ncbi:MAG: ribonuclease P protein component 1 [Candidatus Aenigmarchaeota archaeon]|nr:ribonuclease P protein component 1 [Candidatus Aenigmarchaeota archaeon]
MITPQNLVRHELIGLRVHVAAMHGQIVDETRNTLVIEAGGREKIIPKDGHRFTFTLPSGERIAVDGTVLVGRPEDRIKKKLPAW